MNIQQMVDQGEAIYVVNRSARVLGTAHTLVIEFPHPTGQRGSTVKIPPIKHPINLTRRVAPPSAIPLSTAFIDWVNKGVLEIVDAEEARDILSDPEVRASVEQAYQKLEARRGAALQRNKPNFKVRQGGARETHAVADLSDARMSMSDFQSGSLPDIGLPQPEPQGALTVSAETIQITPRIQNFCAALHEDSSLKGDYLRDLKSWDEATLSDDDIGYMLSQLSDFDNICAYLRSIKADRAGGGEAPKSSGKRRRKGKRGKPNPISNDDL